LRCWDAEPLSLTDSTLISSLFSTGDPTRQIAFFASSDNLGDVGKNQIIAFRYVHTNIGNPMNAHTGVFYCDVPGTYVFFVHMLMERNRNSSFYLSQNEVPVIYLAGANDGTYLGPDSNTAIINLERGDSITVRSSNAYAGDVIDDWSTFSGFLLYPAL